MLLTQVQPPADPGRGPDHDPAPSSAALDDLLRRRDVRAVYQPIVDLDTRATVAWEALARGPVDTPFAFPDQLFGAARRFGRLADLDFCCRAAAVDGAIAAGLGSSQGLFVNIEPEAAAVPRPAFLEDVARRARAEGLQVTIEITERALTTAPAELIALVDKYRRMRLADRAGRRRRRPPFDQPHAAPAPGRHQARHVVRPAGADAAIAPASCTR